MGGLLVVGGCGGEAVVVALLRGAWGRGAIRVWRLVNHYGPTEVTVGCTDFVVVPGGRLSMVSCRSVVRWRIRGCMCWMMAWVRCRWVLRVSCMLLVCSWRVVIWGVRG